VIRLKLAIMQPYFFPYIGYFQLINVVDKYVIYDNIQYTKKGWINRNRILKNGADIYITIPLKSDSAYLNICERSVAISFDKHKFLNKIKDSYRNALYFTETFNLIEQIVTVNKINLFDYLYNSINTICDFLEIKTEIIQSSILNINPNIKGKDKIIKICKSMDANNYINAIGGRELYDKNEFALNGIDLKFLRTANIEYKQFENIFIPNLSIIDVLMFNSKERIREMLHDYELE